MLKSILLSAPALLLAHSAEAFAPVAPTTQSTTALFNVNGVWNTGNSFGKGEFRFYEGLDSFMAPFPDEDRELYPEMFMLPKGLYEVPLAKPCGEISLYIIVLMISMMS